MFDPKAQSNPDNFDSNRGAQGNQFHLASDCINALATPSGR